MVVKDNNDMRKFLWKQTFSFTCLIALETFVGSGLEAAVPLDASPDRVRTPLAVITLAVQTNATSNAAAKRIKYSPMIFGQFIEHFDKQVYGGLFWPGHPLSDEDGFRKDVIEALREIKCPIVRWPGGCFASDYHWKSGVGPRREPLWSKKWAVEDSNTFGTDEFVKWCRKVGCEPYICTNAGSGNEEEMSDWVEYCNLNVGKWGRQRIAHGYEKPYDVMYWSVGNENWGGWEIGAKTIAQWGPIVRESAKMMRGADRRIRLSAATAADGEWILPLLKHAGYLLDYVSVHRYYVRMPDGGGCPYLESMMHTATPDADVRRLIGVLRKAGYGGGKVGIAFDEWNLRCWYHPPVGKDQYKRDVVIDYAGRRKNDIASTYTMADAIFTACFLNMCLRHSDVVKMANFSPSVNTRGMVFVHDKGIVKRTSYHVFWMYTHLLEANVVPISLDCGNLTCGKVRVPVLDAILTESDDGKRRVLVVANKSPDKTVTLDVSSIAARSASAPYQATILSGASTDDYNDIGSEDRIVPVKTSLTVKDGKVVLAPHSVSAIDLCSCVRR